MTTYRDAFGATDDVNAAVAALQAFRVANGVVVPADDAHAVQAQIDVLQGTMAGYQATINDPNSSPGAIVDAKAYLAVLQPQLTALQQQYTKLVGLVSQDQALQQAVTNAENEKIDIEPMGALTVEESSPWPDIASRSALGGLLALLAGLGIVAVLGRE